MAMRKSPVNDNDNYYLINRMTLALREAARIGYTAGMPPADVTAAFAITVISLFSDLDEPVGSEMLDDWLGLIRTCVVANWKAQ
jgi:hypothetical protein